MIQIHQKREQDDHEHKKLQPNSFNNFRNEEWGIIMYRGAKRKVHTFFKEYKLFATTHQIHNVMTAFVSPSFRTAYRA